MDENLRLYSIGYSITNTIVGSIKGETHSVTDRYCNLVVDVSENEARKNFPLPRNHKIDSIREVKIQGFRITVTPLEQRVYKFFK